jgi:hypothetical protein
MENEFNSDTHIQTANAKRKCNRPLTQEPLNTRTVDSVSFLENIFAIRILHSNTKYH